MKIWQLWSDEGYEWFTPTRRLSVEEKHTFDGRSKRDGWVPLALKPLEGNFICGDFANFLCGMPIVSKRVIEMIGDLLEAEVEVLPTICAGREVYILNITNIVDAVDYKNSDVKYFQNTQKVMAFTKVSFCKEKIQGNHIFKLVERRFSSVYVSDEFRQRIIDNNLTGFRFELIWDSEL